MTGVVLLQGSALAVQSLLAVLARKRFEADGLQTLIITSAPTVFFVFSIFWGDFFERRSIPRFLTVYWLVACLPLAFAGLATSAWMLIIPQVIACIGGSGYYPVAGEFLRRLYPERTRGRIFSLLWGAMMICVALASYALGESLKRSPDAFRWCLPLAVGLQLVGVVALGWLAHVTGISASRTLREDHAGLQRIKRSLDPILHMGTVLKQDPIFARYEAAYMTYGIGWMVCAALLPFLVTDKLHLEYDQIAAGTQVSYNIAIVAMIVPAGWVMDRLGAVRTASISFAMLALYPVGLMLAGNAHELTIVSAVYGVAHVGASLAWTLGPVALAPTPAKVPHYVAIHATLVGLRGTIFQGLGVLLYKLTGGFAAPMILGAVAFVWSAVQMWTLHARMGSTRGPAAGGAGVPAAEAEP